MEDVMVLFIPIFVGVSLTIILFVALEMLITFFRYVVSWISG